MPCATSFAGAIAAPTKGWAVTEQPERPGGALGGPLGPRPARHARCAEHGMKAVPGLPAPRQPHCDVPERRSTLLESKAAAQGRNRHAHLTGLPQRAPGARRPQPRRAPVLINPQTMAVASAAPMAACCPATAARSAAQRSAPLAAAHPLRRRGLLARAAAASGAAAAPVSKIQPYPDPFPALQPGDDLPERCVPPAWGLKRAGGICLPGCLLHGCRCMHAAWNDAQCCEGLAGHACGRAAAWLQHLGTSVAAPQHFCRGPWAPHLAQAAASLCSPVCLCLLPTLLPHQPCPQWALVPVSCRCSYGHPGPNPPKHRRAGVILHPTSLPGKYGMGEIGAEAFAFVDWLAATGMQLWQVRAGLGCAGLHCAGLLAAWQSQRAAALRNAGALQQHVACAAGMLCP